MLSSFAIAQPLFQLLSKSEALFLTHGAHPADIILLTLGAVFLPALILISLELLGSFAGLRTLQALHTAALIALLTVILLPVIKRGVRLPAAAAVLLAVAAGIAFAVMYLRARTWRWSVVYLSPAVLVFPALLLFHSPVTGLLMPGHAPAISKARIGNPVPVIMEVFDEFPLASLLDKEANIDAGLYPHFAELARSATWYRNATTAAESTLISVPAILDGKYPDPDHPRLPNAAGHPNNLFTLLGGQYRMNVDENNTSLCPESLCRSASKPLARRLAPLARDASVLWLYAILPSGMTGSLPDISQAWGNFRTPKDEVPTQAMWQEFDQAADWEDRIKDFAHFRKSISFNAWPAVHFQHILLPHARWVFLPTGQKGTFSDSRIRGLRGENDQGEDPNRWLNDPWAVMQAYQHHLLQVQLVDRMVGALIARLKETGLYDSALVVITADHGTSFRPGDSRRTISAQNHADIMAVPLFIKYPHQTAGGIDDREAQNVDILPTIADVLKVRLPEKPDGVSLLGPPPARTWKYVVTDNSRKLRFSPGLNDLLASVQYKLGIFGEGGLFRIGDRYGWIGKEVSQISPVAGSAVRAQVDREIYYTKVDRSAPVLLTDISGHVRRVPGDSGTDPLPLAVAVNGRVEAVTQTYRDGRGDAYSAMVPDSALRSGRNKIGVFLIRPGGSELARLDRPPAPEYAWGTKLTFGSGGNATPYYGTGWSGGEADLTWADGHHATLYLPTRAPARDLMLRINAGAFTSPGKIDRQRVRLLVNRRPVKEWVLVSVFEDCIARIPRQDWTSSEANEIAFDMPDATPPISLGINRDSRTLGMGLRSLTLQPEP